MTEVFKFLIQCINDYIAVLNSITFEFFGYEVHLATFFMSFIIIGFVVAVFWKGARS